MQAQSLRQQAAISTQQSLTVIKTLLSASFGCIAYLRNLLPEENFGEGRLMSGDRESMGYCNQDSPIRKDSRHVSHITVKTVTRGYSTEADKLLNYLEFGIFDAIERQYLKSFIFAIYLDNDDPNNIVESYAFNLTYYTVPGTTITVPIMSLDDQLNKLSINLEPNARPSDAVAQAVLKGRVPTLGDVKQSIKSLIKNLILVTQSMDPLPKRRFATFKVLYQNNTPPDYEPPYFRPGDPEKDRFVFTTHNKSEIPEKISVGTVVTPHHGIDVQVQSIVRFIPNDEKDDSQYLGIDEKIANTGFTSLRNHSDADVRARQKEAQRKDAQNRKFAWKVEDSNWTNEDAEGEDDPEYVNDSGIELDNPLGIRQTSGGIVPISQDAGDETSTESAVQYFGKPDILPSRLGQLGVARASPGDLEPTQQLETIQITGLADECGKESATVCMGNTGAPSTIDTQMLKAALDESAMDWTADGEMLDMETQVQHLPDQARSFAEGNVTGSSAARSRKPGTRASTEKVACACEHDDDDDTVFCEACEKWMHIRCIGYYSANDSRLPGRYVCIPCRLQGDVKFHLIKDRYPEILSAYVDLALFRRAIKFAESNNPGSLKEFRKLTKCSASLSEQLWKRLEHEGFIVLEIVKMDKSGIFETRSRPVRSAKKVKSEKQVQKYVFNAATKKTARYRDYFSPDGEAEKAMIGLKFKPKKTKRTKKGGEDTPARTRARLGAEENPSSAQAGQLEIESQTQDETQFVDPPAAASDLKRRGEASSQETVRTSKKVKISIVEENVDIEE